MAALTISSVVVDDGGEQAIVTVSGVASPLAGTPVFHLNRTPGVQLKAAAFVINSDTQITLNGFQKVSDSSAAYIRDGELVTLDYVSGLTGNSSAITATSSAPVTNNSERSPRILSEVEYACDQDTPTDGFLEGGLDEGNGFVAITNVANGLLAIIQISAGRWASQALLLVGVTYTFEFFARGAAYGQTPLSQQTLTVN